jgi:hypothetical protein
MLCGFTESARVGKASREKNVTSFFFCHFSTYFQQTLFPGLGVKSQVILDFLRLLSRKM